MENSHTTFRNGNLFCLNCGGNYVIPQSIEVGKFSKLTTLFTELHSECEKTWIEPIASQDKSVQERAMFWIANGETGMSSKTMWNCFMNVPSFDVNHPHDPDDFSRCYKLLKQIPEWKSELRKLKPLSKAWSNLVDNWDKLTEMFEQNEKEDWKNYKQIGMYEFMRSLTS